MFAGDKSTIKKRHMHLTEEILKQNPNICKDAAPSLDDRQHILVAEVPKLGQAAAEKAIAEWGQPRSNITHLILCTTNGIDMPGADLRLAKLIGLRPSVKRIMMYQQGCYGGAAALRIAKDLAKNNTGARVLVVRAEIMAMIFPGPSEDLLEQLMGQALFGDGASAVIVGSDPVAAVENSLFDIVAAAQAFLPGTEEAMHGRLREVGIVRRLMRTIPGFISESIERCLEEAFGPLGLGVPDSNSIFLD